MCKSHNYIALSDPRTVDVESLPRISFHTLNHAVMPFARENDAITIKDEEWSTFFES